MILETDLPSAPEAERGLESVDRRSVALERLRAAVADPRHRDEPRHSRLRVALLDSLAAGDWSPGDKLPPETEIAKAVKLSLGTVQKALARLASEQVLVRRHGHGTFVTGDASQSGQLIHFRFVGDDGATLVPVYAEALARDVVRGTAPWSDFLGASNCIRIRRRINVGDEFDCISEYYIDAEKFAAVLELPFRELHRAVIRNVLAKHFNAPELSLSRRIYAAELPAPVRSLLRLPRTRSCGMVLEIESYTHRRTPLSFQNVFIPAGVRHLEISSPAPV
jgi:GntR family transcriptional regulator